jgi:GT2 family glycosyltransferase
MSELPAVSVIVPHYRHEACLRRCLVGLQQQDYAGRVTVFVVDNSEKYALENMAQEFPDFVFLHSAEAGSYHARNLALAQVSEGIVAFTDADCRPRADWIRQGVTVLMQDAKRGLAAGRVEVMPLQSPPSFLDFLEMATAFRQHDYVREGFAATANLFTWRRLFDELGLFDGSLKSGGDFNWGHRVHDAGYVLAYAPEAVVEHDARDAAEFRNKARRLAAARRDRKLPWWDMPWLALCAALPWWLIKRLLPYTHPQLTVPRKVMLLVFGVYTRWQWTLYYIQYRLFGGVSPR